jgi:formate C-acetyltransferase
MNAQDSASIREKLVVKTVHNIRNLRQREETAQGMYRQGIKLDLQRSRLLTESYQETEGEPMVVKRAKALERILTHMDLYIQDWERIVGNNVRTPQGLYFGIDMNWR